MKVTIKELAEKAGVSKTAVSFAFNNPSRISKETYNRIMSIAQEIGYFPDPVARILATHQTQTIGVLFPQPVTEILANPYIAEIVWGAGAVCDANGFSLELLSPLKGIINHTIQGAAVDGMIILGVDGESDVHESFRIRNMPYVAIDAIDSGVSESGGTEARTDGSGSLGYINVGIDDAKLAENLMDILLDNGHRTITVVTLSPIATDLSEKTGHSTTSDVRRRGISRSVEKHGLTEGADVFFTFESIPTHLEESYAAAQRILSQEERPSAVFCMADIQAMGFYRAAQEAGIAIPEELSIVSFDDLPITSVMHPPLTSAHQSAYDKGFKAAELLLAQINGQEVESCFIESHIEVRGSVAAVRGRN